MMQENKKQAKNTSNNSDFSNSLLETRIKEARNTGNNADFSNSLLETRIKEARNTSNNDLSDYLLETKIK